MSKVTTEPGSDTGTQQSHREHNQVWGGGLWAVGTSGTWVTVESPISCAQAKPGQSCLASHHTAWEVQTQKWALENLLKHPRMM